MQKLTITLLILLLPVTLVAQIQSGEVIYKIKILDEKRENTLDTVKPESKGEQMAKEGIADVVTKRERAMPRLKFKLEFTKSEALFKNISGMDSDFDNNVLSATRLALGAVGGKGVFYTNLTDDLIIHQHEYIELILLESKVSEIEWNLEDEFKEIAGYKCQKATTKVYINSMNPNRKITAWFSKELPFSFGPIGQAGLPGLILGLERSDKYMYYADETTLLEKTKDITPPTKGKRVTMDYILKINENPEKYIREYEDRK